VSRLTDPVPSPGRRPLFRYHARPSPTQTAGVPALIRINHRLLTSDRSSGAVDGGVRSEKPSTSRPANREAAATGPTPSNRVSRLSAARCGPCSGGGTVCGPSERDVVPGAALRCPNSAGSRRPPGSHLADSPDTMTPSSPDVGVRRSDVLDRDPGGGRLAMEKYGSIWALRHGVPARVGLESAPLVRIGSHADDPSEICSPWSSWPGPRAARRPC